MLLLVSITRILLMDMLLHRLTGIKDLHDHFNYSVLAITTSETLFMEEGIACLIISRVRIRLVHVIRFITTMFNEPPRI